MEEERREFEEVQRGRGRVGGGGVGGGGVIREELGEEGWKRREGREKSGGNSHFLLLFLFLTEAQGKMLFKFMYKSLRWGEINLLHTIYTDVSWTRLYIYLECVINY